MTSRFEHLFLIFREIVISFLGNKTKPISNMEDLKIAINDFSHNKQDLTEKKIEKRI